MLDEMLESFSRSFSFEAYNIMINFHVTKCKSILQTRKESQKQRQFQGSFFVFVSDGKKGRQYTKDNVKFQDFAVSAGRIVELTKYYTCEKSKIYIVLNLPLIELFGKCIYIIQIFVANQILLCFDKASATGKVCLIRSHSTAQPLTIFVKSSSCLR